MRWKSQAVHVARQAKHIGFVASKKVRVAGRTVKYALATPIAKPYSRLRPYKFDPSRYRRSFLVRSAPDNSHSSELPRRVFVLWTGDNEMSANRTRNLETLRREIGLPVELVTPATLPRWLVDEHPLHPAYEHLSLVHRSDYLRAYLLHHHGGGYCDLKRPLHPWDGAFDRMKSESPAWIAGFGELGAGSAARLPGRLGFDIAIHHPRLLGTAAMIARSRTPLTGEWLREVERRLDYYAPQLKEFPGGVRGEVVGYPVSWTRLLGGIFQPLQLKYLDRVRRDDSLLLDFHDYQ